MKNRKRKKYCPIWSSDEMGDDFFVCAYYIGIYDKYGLKCISKELLGDHTYSTNEYTENRIPIPQREVEPRLRHRKGVRFSKPPYAYNSFKEMIDAKERRIKNWDLLHEIGDVRKEAFYLVIEIDEETGIYYDPYHFKGRVIKRGTVFVMEHKAEEYYSCDDPDYDYLCSMIPDLPYEERTIEITDENRHLIFPNESKAFDYIREEYGSWMASHYLKNVFLEY